MSPSTCESVLALLVSCQGYDTSQPFSLSLALNVSPPFHFSANVPRPGHSVSLNYSDFPLASKSHGAVITSPCHQAGLLSLWCLHPEGSGFPTRDRDVLPPHGPKRDGSSQTWAEPSQAVNQSNFPLMSWLAQLFVMVKKNWLPHTSWVRNRIWEGDEVILNSLSLKRGAPSSEDSSGSQPES